VRIWVVLIFLGLAMPAVAADSDLQQWTTVHLSHQGPERLEFSFFGQQRWDDDVTHSNSQLLGPSVHYKLSERWRLGLGYTYWRKPSASSEHQPWQELVFADRYGDLSLGHRLRVEQRFVNGISGPIWRGRYRLHGALPLGDTPWYLVAADEVFVNLNDRDTGPADGFEQNRLSGGFGLHLGSYVRTELGYTWRYEDERGDSNRSDHVITLNFFFKTRAKKPPQQPHPRESHH
jgi:hypothetical protein